MSTYTHTHNYTHSSHITAACKLVFSPCSPYFPAYHESNGLCVSVSWRERKWVGACAEQNMNVTSV